MKLCLEYGAMAAFVAAYCALETVGIVGWAPVVNCTVAGARGAGFCG